MFFSAPFIPICAVFNPKVWRRPGQFPRFVKQIPNVVFRQSCSMIGSRKPGAAPTRWIWIFFCLHFILRFVFLVSRAQTFLLIMNKWYPNLCNQSSNLISVDPSFGGWRSSHPLTKFFPGRKKWKRLYGICQWPKIQKHSELLGIGDSCASSRNCWVFHHSMKLKS